jgi:hypothetical protein
MSDLTTQSDALIHYKKTSLLTRLGESKALVFWTILIGVLAFLGGLCGGLVGPVIFHGIGMGLVFPICCVVGLGVGLSVVFAVRFADRRFFGAVKAGVAALEDRVIEGSQMSREDLEKLVAGSLKLKRLAAADVYSKRLLAISMLHPDEAAKTADWLVTTECWASTEKYHKGWNYKLVWLFETRGILTLSPDSLDFQSKKFVFSCHPSQITSIKVGRHPLWMKPIPFRFICLTIEECGGLHTFNITPSFGQTDTVWDCNRMVARWVKRLEKARACASKLPPGSTVLSENERLELTSGLQNETENGAVFDA